MKDSDTFGLKSNWTMGNTHPMTSSHWMNVTNEIPTLVVFFRQLQEVRRMAGLRGWIWFSMRASL